jgi:hypothetical protein
MERRDGRYFVELPSGLVRDPRLLVAGDDFQVNDVVRLDGDTVYPMLDDSREFFGVVLANAYKGGRVLVAT